MPVELDDIPDDEPEVAPDVIGLEDEPEPDDDELFMTTSIFVVFVSVLISVHSLLCTKFAKRKNETIS